MTEKWLKIDRKYASKSLVNGQKPWENKYVDCRYLNFKPKIALEKGFEKKLSENHWPHSFFQDQVVKNPEIRNFKSGWREKEKSGFVGHLLYCRRNRRVLPIRFPDLHQERLFWRELYPEAMWRGQDVEARTAKKEKEKFWTSSSQLTWYSP